MSASVPHADIDISNRRSIRNSAYENTTKSPPGAMTIGISMTSAGMGKNDASLGECGLP